MFSKKDDKTQRLIEAKVKKHHIGSYERHIFLCTGDDCCGSGEGARSWDHLKHRLAERGLAPARVFRTKVGCLRICAGGPIGVVYPEGTWYRGLTPEALDRVIEQHLERGQPVEDLILARNPLPAPLVPSS